MSEKRVECGLCGHSKYIRKCDCCGSTIVRSDVSAKDDRDFEVWAIAVNAEPDPYHGDTTPEKFDACSPSCCAALIAAAGDRFYGASRAHAGGSAVGSWRTHSNPTSPVDPITERG